ncbi:nonstructural protein [Blackfly microvirus SF02]|uniref:Nonstructural protein n=1 Tax=Blackfly microvirus SF02 TaxID=2576452 RepID=A0A4P8PKC7_9VIRU|nr:nonstructural protein [Blackfly microvirus SF02]
MKMLIFTVFDSAVGAHLQPFFSRSMGEAIRSFQDAVNDPKTQFNAHSMDYTLFLHGSFDDNGGMFDTAAPERVSSAVELMIKSDQHMPSSDTPAPWNADPKMKIGRR